MFAMKITVAIVLGVLVAADKCADDIKAAAANMSSCALSIVNAVTDCNTVSDLCMPDIGSANEYIDAATKFVNDAVEDCSGQDSTCTGDIADLVTAIGNSQEDLGDAMKVCSLGSEKCHFHILKTVKDSANAVGYIFAATSHCGSGITSMEGATGYDPSEECRDEIKENFKTFARDAKDIFFSAMHCVRNRKECSKDLADIMEKLADVADSLNMIVSVCTTFDSKCLNNISLFNKDLSSARVEVQAARDECASGFTKDCRVHSRRAAMEVLKAGNDILSIIRICRPSISHKIFA